MKGLIVGLIIGVILGVLFLGFFSPNTSTGLVTSVSSGSENSTNNISFSPNAEGYSNSGVSVGYTDPNHHSIPTKMSLQGRVTDFNALPIDDANLGVKISDSNSCSSSVFYDYTFPNLVQDGLFNILLGQNEVLRLNFNQDYFMCLYVNDELLSGPQVFRGGQGEVHAEQLFDGNATTPFDFNYVHVNNNLSVDENIEVGSCGVIYWDEVNQIMTMKVTC